MFLKNVLGLYFAFKHTFFGNLFCLVYSRDVKSRSTEIAALLVFSCRFLFSSSF